MAECAHHVLSCCRYLRVLAAFYIRLTCKSVECYRFLEPLLSDYRKLRYLVCSRRQTDEPAL